MPLSAILMFVALAGYSIGVWSQRIGGRLRAWHLVFFWIGLASDISGTAMMVAIRGLFLSAHVATGLTALLLMLIHTVWATVVVSRKDEKAIVNFHKFSVFVWVVWLIPFFSGFVMARLM
jgi:uncharacterized repeat protein (TIGR03987 family)